jgi:hypothetical protein
LVRGSIPERCLALGFPARVVSREPDFPKPVPDEEKDSLLAGMVVEMMQILRDEGYRCESDGDSHVVEEIKASGWFAKLGRWCLKVHRGPKAEPTQADAAGCDVFLSLWAIPRELRKSLTERGVVWLDLEKKERSDAGNPLGDEVAQHLRRYGVRFFRVQPAELGI